MAFKQFEDIIAWQQARSLASEILAVTGSLEPFQREQELARRMQTVALDMQGVIARSFASKDPQRFLEGLKASICYAEELRALLYIAADRECINLRIFERLTRSIQTTSRKSQELITYIKRQLKSNRMKPEQDPAQSLASQPNTGSFRKVIVNKDEASPAKPGRMAQQPAKALTESGEYEKLDLVPSNDYSVHENPPDWKPKI
mgnify:CR=1 FL=1